MFRKLISLDEARRKIEETLSPSPLGIEEIPLQSSGGRVLAEDLESPINVPPFNRSTVDGYAVKAADTFGAEEEHPIKLRLVGQAGVGEMSNSTIERGSAVEIVTGAPLPIGADAVVMVENTTQNKETIRAYKSVARSENTMVIGSDIRKKEKVLARGSVLSSRHVGVLAALGFAQVRVFKQPKAAIVSTGMEIVEPGKPLPPGKIYDINTYTLSAAVSENGGQPVFLGIVKDDDRELLKATLKKAIDSADIVITSGGVSVGPKDIVPEVLAELGKPGLIVHGVAIKPGKPVAVAVISGKPVFSLPGNPTSSLLVFYLVVRPILFRMTGRSEKPFATIEATTAVKLFPARGRRTFVMVTISRARTGGWLASPVPTGQSGAITTLAKADGFVEIKENQQFIDTGKEVTVNLLSDFRD